MKNLLYQFDFLFSEYSLLFQKLAYPKKVSYCKAQNVAEKLSEKAIVISADTVVILNSVCLVKPQNFKEAFSMLKKLSNRTHKVITAVTTIDTETKKCLQGYELTKVKFKKLTDKEIEDYKNTLKYIK